MDIKLSEILCCPVCKGDLKLSVSLQENNEIIEGNLFCKSCDHNYLINEGIPNLLPPEYNQR